MDYAPCLAALKKNVIVPRQNVKPKFAINIRCVYCTRVPVSMGHLLIHYV